jgi:phenylpyruvate tautomerase PptA (4-oxalocrotonate tautomerase family)
MNYLPVVRCNLSHHLIEKVIWLSAIRLAEAITEDIERILKVPKKDVVIVFQEADHGNWYASGVRL